MTYGLPNLTPQQEADIWLQGWAACRNGLGLELHAHPAWRRGWMDQLAVKARKLQRPGRVIKPRKPRAKFRVGRSAA